MLKHNYKIFIVGLALTVTHLLINQITPYPIQLSALFSVQLFFLSFLLFVKTFMAKQNKKDSSKVWANYILIMGLRFVLVLLFVYLMKNYFDVKTQQALLHIFLWFFIYFFYEIKILKKN